MFFPSRGFLWGWALRGYSFPSWEGGVFWEVPVLLSAPSEPLEPPPNTQPQQPLQ